MRANILMGASTILSSLVLAGSLYILTPPFNIVIGVILAGIIVGAVSRGFKWGLVAGVVAGLLGFLIAYFASGAGVIGFRVMSELLGSLGILAPLIYYPLAVGFTSSLAGLFFQRVLGRGV